MHISQVKEFYDNYVQKLSVKNNRHRRVFESIDKFIPKNCNVLDVGCGTGITSKYLADVRNVWAIDLSDELIEYAKLHNNHENINYYVGNICEPTLTRKFDAICVIDVLEHILSSDREKFFGVLKKVSHEKTKIYLNIPHENVIFYLKENRPELLQIVDNAVYTHHILQRFYDIGFVPAYFQFYWMQYVEYLFVTKESYNETIKGAF